MRVGNGGVTKSAFLVAAARASLKLPVRMRSAFPEKQPCVCSDCTHSRGRAGVGPERRPTKVKPVKLFEVARTTSKALPSPRRQRLYSHGEVITIHAGRQHAPSGHYTGNRIGERSKGARTVTKSGGRAPTWSATAGHNAVLTWTPPAKSSGKASAECDGKPLRARTI